MPAVNRGEELADSDYLPYKNTRGRKFKTTPSARIPRRMGTVVDSEKGIALIVSPTQSEVAAEYESLHKKEHERIYTEMEQLMKEERTKASKAPKKKGRQVSGRGGKTGGPV